MHLDVGQLSAFYLTPLGRIARQIVSAEVRSVWPDVRGERVVGLGHATPYLRPFLGEAERVVSVMPAAEGVLHWPPEGPNVTSLAYEDRLPLPDNSIDKLLIIHLLETTKDPHEVLREAWRVLVPAGRVLVFVPYRAGAWARADWTPMGLGRPFSRAQLARVMDACWLEPKDLRRCLYVPPTSTRFVLGSARAWERIGKRVIPRFAGLVALEGHKTLTRGIPARSRKLADLVPTLSPVPKPAASVAHPHEDDAGAPGAGRDYCAPGAGHSCIGIGSSSVSRPLSTKVP
ncbi:class I SAM-dependent methyltransferase [Acuticoccus sp. I52.16.1]|uniref:class I SAM-dependent methyltransferase n=1 Tax=Acuticoccus sp. I52.16.1 TaxID=2928472 RepID=UPI001FD384BF|nr:methyltransferase domain-containing protein [Acuticoccus sp. I52.16.1]UOM36112.1 methyltransferase domain-containing protein [Acuticoccus sp. I52.16.1]